MTIASLSGKRVTSAGSSFHALPNSPRRDWLMACASAARRQVRATAICPGFVAADMVARLGLDMAQLTQPHDIARIVQLVLELPPTASISEIPLSWTVEENL